MHEVGDHRAGSRSLRLAARRPSSAPAADPFRVLHRKPAPACSRSEKRNSVDGSNAGRPAGASTTCPCRGGRVRPGARSQGASTAPSGRAGSSWNTVRRPAPSSSVSARDHPSAGSAAANTTRSLVSSQVASPARSAFAGCADQNWAGGGSEARSSSGSPCTSTSRTRSRSSLNAIVVCMRLALATASGPAGDRRGRRDRRAAPFLSVNFSDTQVVHAGAPTVPAPGSACPLPLAVDRSASHRLRYLALRGISLLLGHLDRPLASRRSTRGPPSPVRGCRECRVAARRATRPHALLYHWEAMPPAVYPGAGLAFGDGWSSRRGEARARFSVYVAVPKCSPSSRPPDRRAGDDQQGVVR
jgi:hypothetical protein